MSGDTATPEQLYEKAVAAHQAGSFDEAEALYHGILQQIPDHPAILTMLGVLSGQRGDAAAAVDWLGRAVNLSPGDTGTQYNLGTALLELKKFADAAEVFRRVLSLDAGHAGAAFNLGKALQQSGQVTDAVVAFGNAVSLRPDHVPSQVEWAACLAEIGNSEEARMILERVTERKKGTPASWHDLGLLRLKDGDWDGAITAFDGALAIDPWHVRSVAFKGIALHEAGQDAEAAQLNDLDGLIDVGPLATDFPADQTGAALIDALTNHPSLVWERPNTTTLGGAQTGNLVEDENPAVSAFVAALTARIEAYVAACSTEAGHPFTARIPTEWRYSIWATILERDGHQAPHLHPGGWLSGVYYAEVPDPVLSDENTDHAGWIEFGAPGYGVEAVRPPRLRYIRPEPGNLVLFPSCFFHRTVPLADAGRRISIAFDLIPLAWRAA